MTAPTKGELDRTVKRLYALSMAFLRAETAYETYHQEATKLFANRESDEELEDELLDDLPIAISQLENNTLIRTGSLLSIYFGLLYAVVEAWGKWKVVDATVDALLQSPYTKDLWDYRNAIFHVSEIADPRIMQWGLEKERVVWTNKLSAALRAAILDYHDNLVGRVTVQLRRKGQ